MTLGKRFFSGLKVLCLCCAPAVFSAGASVAQDTALPISGEHVSRINQMAVVLRDLGVVDPAVFAGLDAAQTVSSDLLFLFEELQRLESRLSDGLADIQTACRTEEMTLALLSNSACLEAVVLQERRVWRIAAEIGAQLHLMARQDMVAHLPLPAPDPDLSEAGRKALEDWWTDFVPKALDVLARVGRQRARTVDGESSETEAAETIEALQRVLREPGMKQLVQALSSAAGNDVISGVTRHVGILANQDQTVEARLDAAMAFGADLDLALSTQAKRLLDDVLTSEGDTNGFCKDFDPKLPVNPTTCAAALAVFKSAFDDTIGERKDEVGKTGDEVFHQKIQAAIRERIETLRLLVAKTVAIHEMDATASCAEMVAEFAKANEPTKNASLDRALLAQAAKGIERAAQSCLDRAAAPLLSDLCSVVDVKRLSVDASQLPADVEAALGAPWNTFVQALGKNQTEALCQAPASTLLDLENVSDGWPDAEAKALTAAIKDYAETRAISQIRSVLDRVTVPRPALYALKRLGGVCNFRNSGSLGPANAKNRFLQPERFDDKIVQAVLIDLDVIRLNPEAGSAIWAPEFDALCEANARAMASNTLNDLGDVLEDMGSENAASESDAIAPSQVLDWGKGLFDRVESDGVEIARRAVSAAALAQAVNGISETLGVRDGVGCQSSDQQGKGLTVALATDELSAEFGSEPWTVSVTGKVRLIACGATSKDPRSIQTRTDLVTVNASFKQSFELAAEPNYSLLLEDAVRNAYKTADIDASGLEAEAKRQARRLLQSAGLEISTLQLLTQNGITTTWDDEIGLILKTSVSFGFDEVDPFSLCLVLPIGEASLTQGCVPADDLSDLDQELENWVLTSLAPKILTDLVASLGLDPDSLSDGASTKLLGDGIKVRVAPQPDNASLALRIVIEDAPLNAVLSGLSDLPRLTGSLDYRGSLNLDGTFEGRLHATPKVDTEWLIQQAADLIGESGVIVAERRDPPTDPCGKNDNLHLALSLGPDAPLKGALGSLCFQKGEPKYEAPDDGIIATTDDSWRFAFRRSGNRRIGEADTLSFGLTLVSAPERFAVIEDQSAELTYRDGRWSLPAAENEDLYTAIHHAASDILPLGFRLSNIEISSDGVRLDVDGSEVPAELLKLAEDQGWPTPIGKESCDTLALVDLGYMLTRARVPNRDIEVCKDHWDRSDHPTANEIEFFSAFEVEWDCDTKDQDDGSLESCTVEVRPDLDVCRAQLEANVTWPDGSPEVEAPQIEQCLEDALLDVLPGPLADDDLITVAPMELADGCMNGNCALTSAIRVDLKELAERISDGGGIVEQVADTCGLDDTTIELRGQISLDGRMRFDTTAGDGSGSLKNALDRCVDALASIVAMEALAAADKNGLELDDALESTAEIIRTSLDTVGETTGTVFGLPECELLISGKERQPCESLDGPLLSSGQFRGAVYSYDADIYEKDVVVEARLAIEEGSELLSLPTLVQLATDKKDDFTDVLEEDLDPGLELLCPGDGKEGAACLGPVIEQAIKDLGIDAYVALDGPVTTSAKSDALHFGMPIRVRVPEIGIDVPVALECQLGPKTAGCTNRLEDILLKILVDEVAKAFGETHSFDLGIVTLELSNLKRAPSVLGLLFDAKAVLGDLGIDLPDVTGKVTVDLRGGLDVDLDTSGLQDVLTSSLKDQVNAVLGEGIFGVVEIKEIRLRDAGQHGFPQSLEIESVANIGDLIKISAPMLVLDKDGLRVDGPRQFTLEVPDNLTIPAPPFAVCPSGGTLDDTLLTLRANVTVGECTASRILKLAGALTIDVEKPLYSKTRGDLVLLTMLNLGYVEGETDLGIPQMKQTMDFGGVAKDIIRIFATFDIDGDDPEVTAEGSVDVFTVRLGEANFLLNLKSGVLDTSYWADVFFFSGDGSIKTEENFSRPRADINSEMSVAGFTAFGSHIKARPRFAKVGFTIFGFRLAVAFPGLDVLDPDVIADLIRNLLTPNFENLDKAIAALFSGNVTMNPFADFGNGGDGMGGDSDGDAGESGDDGSDSEGGANDPGNGLATEENGTAEPDQEPAGDEPSGGLVGTEAAPIWFARNGDLITIGTGTQAGPDSKEVALAQFDHTHFAEDGRRLGQTLAVLPKGYSQLLKLQNTLSVKGDATVCTGGGHDGLVALYTTAPDPSPSPRRGTYALCRLLNAAGTPMTRSMLSGLSPEHKADLNAFHSALMSELRSRTPLPANAHDFGRILLRGQFFGPIDTLPLRGIVGFQRPGEVIIVATGALGTEGACGETPRGAPSEEPKTQIFWLTGDTQRLSDTATLLPKIAALWNCEPGTLARIDVDRLVTPGAISQVSNGELVKLVEIPEVEDPQNASASTSSPPSWVAEAAAEASASQAAAAEAAAEENELTSSLDSGQNTRRTAGVPMPSLCVEGCTPIELSFSKHDAGCRLSLGTRDISTFAIQDGFTPECAPPPTFWFLGSSDTFANAILDIHPEEPGTVRLSRFVTNSMTSTPGLAFNRSIQGLRPSDIRFFNRVLEQFQGNLGSVEGLSHETGLLAAISDRIWLISDNWGEIEQRGDGTLTPEQKVALLPLLNGATGDQSFEVPGDGIVRFYEADNLWLYTWVGANWQLSHRVNRGTVVQRHAVSDNLIEKDRPIGTHARVYPGPEYLAYAWGAENTDDTYPGGVTRAANIEASATSDLEFVIETGKELSVSPASENTYQFKVIYPVTAKNPYLDFLTGEDGIFVACFYTVDGQLHSGHKTNQATSEFYISSPFNDGQPTEYLITVIREDGPLSEDLRFFNEIKAQSPIGDYGGCSATYQATASDAGQEWTFDQDQDVNNMRTALDQPDDPLPAVLSHVSMWPDGDMRVLPGRPSSYLIRTEGSTVTLESAVEGELVPQLMVTSDTSVTDRTLSRLADWVAAKEIAGLATATVSPLELGDSSSDKAVAATVAFSDSSSQQVILATLNDRDLLIEPRGLALSQEALRAALHYARDTERLDLQVVRAQPPIAVARKRDQAWLVRLEPRHADTPYHPLSDDPEMSDNQARERLLDLFVLLSAPEPDAELTDGPGVDMAWANDGALGRLTKIGPRHVVDAGGNWACLNLVGTGATVALAEGLLGPQSPLFLNDTAIARCPGDTKKEETDTPAEDDGKVARFFVSSPTVGLLSQYNENGLHLAPFVNGAFDGSIPLGSIGLPLSRAITRHFEKEMAASGSGDSLEGLTVARLYDDVGQGPAVVLQTGAERTKSWTIGFYLKQRQDEREARICVWPAVQITLPGGAASVPEQIFDSVEALLRSQTDCDAGTPRRFVVTKTVNGLDVYLEILAEYRAPDDNARPGWPGQPTRRATQATWHPNVVLASFSGPKVRAGALQAPNTLATATPGPRVSPSYRIWDRFNGEARRLHVDTRIFAGITTKREEDAQVQSLLQLLQGVADDTSEDIPKNVTLTCGQTSCDVIDGPLSRGAHVALGQKSGVVMRSYGAKNVRELARAAVDETAPNTAFVGTLRSGVMVVHRRRDGAVLRRGENSMGWQAMGTLTLPVAASDDAQAAMQQVALLWYVDNDVSADGNPLGAKPENMDEPLRLVRKNAPREWTMILPPQNTTGTSVATLGATYWVKEQETEAPTAIAEHLSKGQAKGNRLYRLFPGPKATGPAAYSVLILKRDRNMSQALSVQTIDGHSLMEWTPNAQCAASIETLETLVWHALDTSTETRRTCSPLADGLSLSVKTLIGNTADTVVARGTDAAFLRIENDARSAAGVFAKDALDSVAGDGASRVTVDVLALDTPLQVGVRSDASVSWLDGMALVPLGTLEGFKIKETKDRNLVALLIAEKPKAPIDARFHDFSNTVRGLIVSGQPDTVARVSVSPRTLLKLAALTGDVTHLPGELIEKVGAEHHSFQQIAWRNTGAAVVFDTMPATLQLRLREPGQGSFDLRIQLDPASEAWTTTKRTKVANLLLALLTDIGIPHDLSLYGDGDVAVACNDGANGTAEFQLFPRGEWPVFLVDSLNCHNGIANSDLMGTLVAAKIQTFPKECKNSRWTIREIDSNWVGLSKTCTFGLAKMRVLCDKISFEGLDVADKAIQHLLKARQPCVEAQRADPNIGLFVDGELWLATDSKHWTTTPEGKPDATILAALTKYLGEVVSDDIAVIEHQMEWLLIDPEGGLSLWQSGKNFKQRATLAGKPQNIPPIAKALRGALFEVLRHNDKLVLALDPNVPRAVFQPSPPSARYVIIDVSPQSQMRQVLLDAYPTGSPNLGTDVTPILDRIQEEETHAKFFWSANLSALAQIGSSVMLKSAFGDTSQVPQEPALLVWQTGHQGETKIRDKLEEFALLHGRHTPIRQGWLDYLSLMISGPNKSRYWGDGRFAGVNNKSLVVRTLRASKRCAKLQIDDAVAVLSEHSALEEDKVLDALMKVDDLGSTVEWLKQGFFSSPRQALQLVGVSC